MANSKIYLGSTNIGSLFQGADDISIYLGENKVYPLAEPTFKWKAIYSNGNVTSAECDSSSAITQNEMNLTGLVSVEIGDYCVTSIGDKAFNGCGSLTSIDIPSGVTSIGDRAFWSCSSLASIDIPSGVTSIGDRAFASCTGLTSIDIPDSVTSIGGNAFNYCSSLTSVTIGSGVTSIGGYAFYLCSSLTSITVNAVFPPTLGNNIVFNGSTCPIYVPCESVEAYKSASGWSTYASRITCPPFEGKFKATYSGGETYELACDGNTTLSTGNTKPSGYDDSVMTEAVIGDCVDTIGQSAFYNCTSLTSINIPSGVTTIGDSAFQDCRITSIDIPSGVTSIGFYAFSHCISLTSITIPDSVASIGGAFDHCESLTNVSIGSGVTSIGDEAFWACYSLTSVTVNATTPPTLGRYAFDDTNDCPIYVPRVSVNDYRSASDWSDYASRIQAIP